MITQLATVSHLKTPLQYNSKWNAYVYKFQCGKCKDQSLLPVSPGSVWRQYALWIPLVSEVWTVHSVSFSNQLFDPPAPEDVCGGVHSI
jgi:hypothetical protein